MTEKNDVTMEKQTEQVVANPEIITMPIKKPIVLNGAEVNELVLDFSNLTGKDILNVDAELRMNGRHSGFDSIYNQDAMLKLAARATNSIPEDLEKLHAMDFFEMVMQVRAFFLKW
ncbi:phage tail assembly protein [Lysinibacillus sp. UGB7]|uniref:phage tail assembly protein n=1 Tax=Lysinibacillus sp. UGB7 TaxID=3411039 RepID=UPI003B790299